MALEIERRFLVSGDGWRRHVRWERWLCQGYLADDGHGLTLRVRLSEGEGGEQAWLTLKAPQPAPPDAPPGASAAVPDGLSRLEFEYAVPLADARAMLALVASRIGKRRYGLDLPGGDWVLDVFEAPNAPLVVAEVELDAADAAVAIPPWCGREITGRHELSNAGLARRPLASWSDAERLALFAAGHG